MNWIRGVFAGFDFYSRGDPNGFYLVILTLPPQKSLFLRLLTLGKMDVSEVLA